MAGRELTAHPTIPHTYVHGPSGCVVHAVGSLDEIMAANGAFVIVLDNSGNATEWAWVAGVDLLDLRRLSATPSELAIAITRAENRGGLISVCCIAEPTKEDPRFVALPAFGAPAGNPNSHSLFANPGATVLLFGMTTALHSGNGSSASAGYQAADTLLAGTTDERALFGRALPGRMPSTVVGTGQIRIPGGMSWLSRIDQYYDGVLANSPGDVKPLIAPRIPAAKRRAVGLLSSLVPDLKATIDVYMPVVIFKDGSVAIIPPSNMVASINHPMEGGSRPTIMFPPWGLLFEDFITGRRATFPVRYTASGPGGSVFSNAFAGAEKTVTDAMTDAKIASYPRITSIDRMQIGVFTGGLQGNVNGLAGGTKPADSAPWTSAGIWTMYRDSITITDGPGPSIRPIDPSTGLPAAEAVYANQLTTELSAKTNGALRAIGATSWDYGRLGLGMLISVCDAATQPKKAKGWEVIRMAKSPIQYRSFWSVPNRASNAATVGTGDMFDDKTDCFTDLAS